MTPRQKVIGGGFALAAVFVAALNLRAGISSVGPVLGDLLAWYDASGALAGLITAMPGLFFAVMGLAAVPIASRLGLSRTLLLGMTMTLLGLALRPWTGGVVLFLVLTALVVAGIALSNVLLPAWIKLHGGKNVVALMTVNGAVLGLSGGLGPLSAALADGPGGWRDALFVWAWIALAQVLVWVVVALRTGYDFPSHSAVGQDGRAPTGSLWRSSSALALMSYFGLQSMQAYIQMGWLPQILIDAGVDVGVAALALSLTAVFGVAGGLIMPTVVQRSRWLPGWPLLFGVVTVAGYVGLLVVPATVPLVWAGLLGLGGWAFPTALNLIVVKSRHPLVAARLSGFVQPYGYVIAAVGPLLVGLAYRPEHPHTWTGIITVLIVLAALKGLVGMKAAKPGLVDDELGRISTGA